MKKHKNTNKEKDGDVNTDEDADDIDDEYEELNVVTMLTIFFLFTSPISLIEKTISLFPFYSNVFFCRLKMMMRYQLVLMDVSFKA